MTATEAQSAAGKLVGPDALASYPLLDAMADRRARRFALGDHFQSGAFSFQSEAAPVPLSVDEEAVLAFAGAGVTGRVLGELPYQPSAGPETGGGQIMTSLVGRTFPSADGVASATLFVTRDDGTFYLPRPPDVSAADFDELVSLGRQHRFTEMYQRMRVRLSERRSEISREVPFTAPFNKWSANLPGTSYFVPVSEVTGLYMGILFAALGEEFGYYFHDDKDPLLRPAGIGRFAKSKGGHLRDDVRDGRVATIDELERYVLELCAVEQGLMIQNLSLATEALGLGGFTHYAAHRFAWTRAFGFQMRRRTLAQVLHKGFFGTLFLRLLRKNIAIPEAVGLTHDGTAVFRPYAPPYYRTMEEAVRAFVADKFAPGRGIFRDPSGPSAWRDPAAIQASIPEYSEANIEAVIAYCEYVMKHYGQFPANYGPFRTLMAFQAHHLDTAFYDRFYREGAYTEAHAQHFRRWHPNDPAPAT